MKMLLPQRIAKSFPMLFVGLMMLQHLAASKVDYTTEYSSSSLASSKANAPLSGRSPKIVAATVATPVAAATATTISSDAGVGEEPSLQLYPGGNSVKSYITAPTTPTTPPKLTKRAGPALGESVKQKKSTKSDGRNQTRETEGRSKLQSVAADHIPDSSGHIPYRISRPLLPPPPPDYGVTSSSGAGNIAVGPPVGISGNVAGASAGGYPPYEQEKYHGEYWEQGYKHQYGYNNTRVQHIEAECQDDFMKIRVGFNGTFNGLVYSAGYAYDPDCMYINGSGRDYYEFYIQLNRCGTLGKNALHDETRKNPTNFMWNTVTVQYNPLIEEEYDEHFKVTCEYGYDFWKTVTFPFLDVEVATGNPVVFTLSPPECYMEIQNGYGIGGPRVTGPVRVGDPLTLIIYMRSKYDGFDIVVNDCFAHNGANKRIQLIDEYGCPVDDKLISRFRGSWSDSGVFETQVYAYMKTFRFTGSPALYIECDVRMCHGRCPSQPCHWRNLKAVTKRDISNASLASSTATTEATERAAEGPPLSENVNLFQSLRVLQEGESDTDDSVYGGNAARRLHPGGGPHQTCLKTTTLSALSVTFSLVLCLLSGALMVSCSRLKQRSKDAGLYDSTYITHKGQID